MNSLPPAAATLNLEQAVGQKLLLTFHGKKRLPAGLELLLRHLQPAGFTLFRTMNVENVAQVRQLTSELQSAARRAGLPPLLIATDQETGQLMAVEAGATAFPGAMALGAANSEDLAYRVAHAIGLELSAMGINVNYAPVCDVNSNPLNPVVGVRSLGDDPTRVAALAAAQVRGLQAAGVAATAKHFPGHGDVASDSHYGVPVLEHDLHRMQREELPPFRAAIAAGVKLTLTAHLAVPALDGYPGRPATFSPAVLRGLLRDELGFEGVTITDAMDMGAVSQGEGLTIDALAAAAAGMDVLLLNVPRLRQVRVREALLQSYRRGLLDPAEAYASAGRVLALKDWLTAQPQQPLEVIGCSAHAELAYEAACRSLTLVQNHGGLLPLNLDPGDRLAVVLPRPQNLTPADTSVFARYSLAAELRRFHPRVEEYDFALDPQPGEGAALAERLSGCKALVLGSINANSFPRQQAFINEVLHCGVPAVLAALRLPYDAALFPQAAAAVCTYSLVGVSQKALAAALMGRLPWPGVLPVRLG